MITTTDRGSGWRYQGNKDLELNMPVMISKEHLHVWGKPHHYVSESQPVKVKLNGEKSLNATGVALLSRPTCIRLLRTCLFIVGTHLLPPTMYGPETICWAALGDACLLDARRRACYSSQDCLYESIV